MLVFTDQLKLLFRAKIEKEISISHLFFKLFAEKSIVLYCTDTVKIKQVTLC